MNRLQAHRIRSSFQTFEPCGEACVARGLIRLEDQHPTTRRLFPEDSAPHHKAFFATLRQIARNLDQFSNLEIPLEKLGGQALAAGAKPEHFRHVRAELLATMRELAGSDWSAQLEHDWTFALEAVCGAMMRSARKAA